MAREVGARLPAPPPRISRRAGTLLAILGAGIAAYFALGLSFKQLLPRAGGLRIARDFFAAALTPALDYEATDLPADIAPFLFKVLDAVRATVVFAAAAMALALLIGLPLGCLAAESWWQGRGKAGVAVRWCVRGFVIALRSVHELFWAVLFLAAFGLSPATGVLAIAIPYAGTLAKVFSEMLDEAPRRAAQALEGLGASPSQRFLFGLLPTAAPDLAAYAFYRFECSVRAAAVLGFFGIPTLGLHLKLSFENLHYAEVWTYLYAMIAVVLLLEAWSSRLRRRFVA
jgi:phosphonate transport system permease protein